MRVVFDTSVLVAALITTGGACAEALRVALAQHTVVTSNYILNELAEKLRAKFAFSAADIRAARGMLQNSSEIVEPIAVRVAQLRDAQDLPILGTALAARADMLVSVDKDLLSLGRYKSIIIIKPGAFLLAAHGGGRWD